MKVFKFGGASINEVGRMHQAASIICEAAKKEKLLVVVSAMGKTTNALEKVNDSFTSGDSTTSLALFEQLKNQHLDRLKQLNVLNWKLAEDHLKNLFTEIEWLLHDQPVRHFDYYYDQIVSCGELFSTAIMSHLLLDNQCRVKWVDVRDILRTDNNFRDATIDWAHTTQQFNSHILPLFDNFDIVITQGYIGATDENESTTLGREGSDYSAAIFAHLGDAESVTIWKDVDAVMSADPRKFPDAEIIPHLSFSEVIEMSYYGAQVIHPKTIKPLQNKNIPLLVKSFLDPGLPGTIISSKPVKNLPPIIVSKENQVLIRFSTKDFSFIEDQAAHQLHYLYQQLKIKPNLSQHTAISILCCFDNHPEKIDLLAGMAATYFDVAVEKDLQLFTIRHYKEDSLQQLLSYQSIILEQRTLETVQAVIRK